MIFDLSFLFNFEYRDYNDLMNPTKRLFPLFILLFFSSIMLSYFLFKVFSPGAGLIGISQTHWSYSDTFDQSVSLTSARNYADNGFLKNNGLQDRSGISVHSRYRVPCHGDIVSPPVKMHSFVGEPQDIVSLRGECVYTKAPPLVFLAYGVLVKVFDSERAVRAFAVCVHILLFFAIFFFLKAVFGVYPAFYTMLVYGISPLYWGWAHFLYSHSFSMLFTILSFSFIHVRSSRYAPAFVCAFLASFSLVDIIPILICYPWGLAVITFDRRKLVFALLATLASCASLFLLFLLASNYMGGGSVYLNEYLQLNSRYAFFGSYFELYQIMTNIYFSELLEKTFYPFVVLALMLFFALFVLRRTSKLYRYLPVLFSSFVASFCMPVVFGEHSFYHARAVFYFSQLFWLSLICIFFASLLTLRRTSIGHVISFVFVIGGMAFSAPNIYKDFLQLLSHNKIFYKGDLSRNIVDLSLEHLPSADSATYSMDEFWAYQVTRMALIDGFYVSGQPGFVLKKRANTTVNFFFNRSYRVNQIAFLAKDTEVDTFLKSCRVMGRNKSYNAVQYEFPTISPFEFATGYSWISFNGAKDLVGGLIECNILSELELFELRVL